jgi:hypothetical protein
MTKRTWSNVLPLLATLAVMGVSAVANTRAINGLRTGQISNRLPTGFTPAGWVFSIWSLIYIGLLAYSGSQLFGSPAVRERGARIRSAFLVTSVANVAWIFAWHHLMIGVSFALMLTLFGALMVIYRTLRRAPARSRAERLCVDVPFSLYAGWITTATIANLGALLSSTHAYPFGLGMDTWALGSVVFAAVVYVGMGLVTRDAVYGAVYVWAALGIALKPTGITRPVQLAAFTTGGLVLGLVLFLAVRAHRAPRAQAAPLRT